VSGTCTRGKHQIRPIYMYIYIYIYILYIYVCVYIYIYLDIAARRGAKDKPRERWTVWSLARAGELCQAPARAKSTRLGLYIYVYVYIYTYYICIYICIYIFIYRHQRAARGER